MFQVMVEIDRIMDLRAISDSANSLISDGGNFFSMTCFAPGSLGVPVVLLDHVIGSISFKIETGGSKYSILLFKNGKMKISGGSSAFYLRDDDVTYYDWLREDVVIPMVEFVMGFSGDDFDEDDYTWRVTLINGSIRIDPTIVNIATYRDVCDTLVTRVNMAGKSNGVVSVQSPFDSRFIRGRHGRVNSLVIKCVSPDTGLKPHTVRFDQGGHVHFFAFKSLTSMADIWRELSDLIT